MKFYIWGFFEILSRSFKFHRTRTRIKGTLHEDQYKFIISRSLLAHFFLELEMDRTNIVDKIRTHILCSVTFFRKSCRLWEKVGKYRKAVQATWQHGTCALRAGYLSAQMHTLTIRNIHYFSTATMVARTRHNVTL